MKTERTPSSTRAEKCLVRPLPWRAALSLMVMVGVAAGMRASAAPFTAGNLVVIKLGDGITPTSSLLTAPVFLNEYTTAGVLVQSIPVPATGGSQLTMVGSTSECGLTRSPDGSRLYFGGYRTNVGASGTGGTAAATINRVIGYVDAAGTVNTDTVLTDAEGAMRCVASTGSGGIYVETGLGGLRYKAAHGSAVTTSVQIDSINGRLVQIFNNVLYASNTVPTSVAKLQSFGGLPTTTTAPTTVLALGGSANTSAVHGFALLDMSAGVAGDDTIYAVDVTQDQLIKYNLISGVWTARGSISTAGLTSAGVGLAASASGSDVNIYLVNHEFGGDPSTVWKLTDTSGYNANINGTLTSFISSVTGTDFRNIALAPAGATAPEIAVSEAGAGNINDGGSFSFGTTTVGTPVTKTFTVTNSGDAVLNLTNLQVTAGFTIAQNFGSSTVAANGGTTTFQITMNAGAVSTPGGTVTITNNDASEGTFDFSVSGTVNPAPVAVSSLVRANANPSRAATVNWTLTFASAVTGLNSTHFSLSGAGAAGTAIGSVTTGNGGLSWNIPVATAGDGALTLNLANASALSAPISTALPYAGESYTIDKTPPTVVSVARLNPTGQQTNNTSVTFRVTYSEPVALNAPETARFQVVPLNGSDITGTVASVSGTGDTRDVTVNLTGGTGEFRLRVID